VEEILNFSQADLVPEDVMILDVGETLFVWLGGESNPRERSDAMLTAKDYLLSDPSGRSTDIPIVVVKQGFEPPNFTGFFGAWDADLLGVIKRSFCFSSFHQVLIIIANCHSLIVQFTQIIICNMMSNNDISN
jgi:hypothetical protein